MWLLLRRVQQRGRARDPRRHRARPQRLRARRRRPGRLRRRAAAPVQRAAPTRCCSTTASVLLTLHARPGARRRAASAPIRRSPACASTRSVPLVGGPCDDWRGGAEGRLRRPVARCASRGALPGGLRREGLADRLRRPAQLQRARAGRPCGASSAASSAAACATAPRPRLPPSFELRSPPLAEVVRDINKFSNNVMAQQLFLTLGAARSAAPARRRRRASVLRQWLREPRRRAPRAGARDRQRLGPVARHAPAARALLGQLLQAAWASPVMPELMSSLPVAGIDGTLRRSRAAPGRAHLKTGSLRDVAGVAGYVLGDSGRRYVRRRRSSTTRTPNAGAAGARGAGAVGRRRRRRRRAAGAERPRRRRSSERVVRARRLARASRAPAGRRR